ncbi:FAD-containing monooxygenase EthA, partial [Lachnellula suecica]
MSASTKNPTTFDIVIVGAGISGINAAYRLQTQLPGSTYTILEARGAIGGTWDLFRYPGVRSDSSMHTLGFSWRPWKDAKTMVGGEAIREYLQDSARENGIDGHIQFKRKLVAADWESEQQAWRLKVDAEGETEYFSGRFLILGTGYYDYANTFPASIPGIESFGGAVIHPQFWPQDLDYADKKVVIIGSGATAVTLLPELTKKAAHVTMIQRSPSYIASQPSVDPIKAKLLRWFPWLPYGWIYRLTRWRSLIMGYLFLRSCQKNPDTFKKLLIAKAAEQLPSTIPVEPHFTPVYNPWEQRLCASPDGDFYAALRTGNAHVVTGTIESVTADGILVSPATTGSSPSESDVMFPADIIIVATGLQLQMAGGATLSVDGSPVAIGQQFWWKGALLQDVPNMALTFGYTSLSWTLGVDATALLVCRILKYMRRRGMTSVVPRMKENERNLKLLPALNLSSTYIKRNGHAFPKCGGRAPWRPRTNYLWDVFEALWGSLGDGLEFRTVS